MFLNKNQLIPRIGVVSVCSPLEVGADRAPQAALEIAQVLKKWGYELVEGGAINHPDQSVNTGLKLAESHVHAIVVVSASWFEDYLILDLLEECPAPILLWALPGLETGALCGTQQLAAYFKQLDIPHRCLYGPLEADSCRQSAREFLRAAALKYKLRRARVGFAGYRVSGMTEISANEFALKKSIGSRLVPIDVPQLLQQAEKIPDDQVRETWDELVSRSGGCRISLSEGLDSVKKYMAVLEEIKRHRLEALTIGCYPNLMGRFCLAASLLADLGIPLGCEGDVNGSIGQLILTWLTQHPTHNTDWLEPLADGTVVMTHCGSGSFSLAEQKEDIQLSPVRLMNEGLCVLFPAKPGPVTLLNIMPLSEGYQVALLEGEAVRTEMVFPGNPLRVRFSQPTNRILEWIFSSGVGHHWMAGYGCVGNEIRQWAALCQPYLRLLEL